MASAEMEGAVQKTSSSNRSLIFVKHRDSNVSHQSSTGINPLSKLQTVTPSMPSMSRKNSGSSKRTGDTYSHLAAQQMQQPHSSKAAATRYDEHDFDRLPMTQQLMLNSLGMNGTGGAHSTAKLNAVVQKPIVQIQPRKKILTISKNSSHSSIRHK